MSAINLQNIQSTILFRHGREYTHNIFISLNPNINHNEQLKKRLYDWLITFKKKVTTAAQTQPIYTTRKLISKQILKDNNFNIIDENLDIHRLDLSRKMEGLIEEEYKKNPKETDGGLVSNILFSYNAYQYLDNVQHPQDSAFIAGMTSKKVNEKLKDTGLEYWGNNYSNEEFKIDILFLLADDDEERLKCESKLITNFFKNEVYPNEALGQKVFTEKGKVLRDKMEKPIEPFGYRDGIKQPIFFPNSILDEQKAKEVVLVKDPNSGNDYGSFLVYRKLQQDVEEFNRELKTLSDRSNHYSEDYFGAQVFGRFKNGIPIINSDKATGHQQSININDHFTFDNSGDKCPYHAHIRKVNPRDKNKPTPEISRIGIPYEERIKGIIKKGLLFMCFQKNIEKQFEFIQCLANNPINGIDPVIGQKGKHDIVPDQKWNQTYDTRDPQYKFEKLITNLVVLKGGEYLYAPPISILDKLNQHITT